MSSVCALHRNNNIYAFNLQGRKSRRERRAYKEKKLQGRTISPPRWFSLFSFLTASAMEKLVCKVRLQKAGITITIASDLTPIFYVYSYAARESPKYEAYKRYEYVSIAYSSSLA